MKHYKNTEQITKLIESKPFKLPKYPPSTTDPTYYEPSATRIANMRKSASAGPRLYDYDGSDLPILKDKSGKESPDWSKQDISKARITPGRKPGLTREEISQNLTDAQNDYNKFEAERKDEKETLEKQINDTKTTLKALSESSDNSSNKE